MSYTYQLPDEELERRFRRRIAPMLAAEIHSSSAPELVVLGGQPASGKTRSRHLVMSDERFAGTAFFAPEGDALRVWHPDYDRAVREDPLLMPEVTKQASGAWLKSSIELGFERRASMLIEGTWRDPGVPLATLARARELGYRTHAVVVAVPPEVSRVEMLARYYEPALNGEASRWTPPAAHDEAVANLEDTAMSLARSGDLDTVSVVTRDAEFVVDRVPPGPQRPKTISNGLERARAAFWTPSSRSAWLDRVDTYFEAHQQLTSEAPEAIAVWDQLLNHDVPALKQAHPLSQPPARVDNTTRLDAALERLRGLPPLTPSNSEQVDRSERTTAPRTQGPYLG